MQIINSLTGKKEPFISNRDDNVKLYVCGITPYDYAHVGHGRCYVTFDLLYRLLSFLGYTVTYVRNFTDIDDKIIKKAYDQYGDRHAYAKISQQYIDAYTHDMSALHCQPPTVEPRVTQMIPDIIAFIEQLIKKGHAYQVDGDVYFDVHSFPAYLALSKHKLQDLRSGARVELNDKKRDPLDFALWKSEPEGSFFKSPWGYGRPGWHIECSVMAAKYLGATIDIHAGGQDLIFPHHENEIAQSEALHGTPLARYWMHNGFVQINKEKMSKSLGNFFTLRDIFERFDPVVIRYYILTHHYRAPLDFSFDDVEATQKTYKRLVRLFSTECPPLHAKDIQASSIVRAMLTFVEDDLNTPGALGVLFEHIDTIQSNMTELCAVKGFLQQVFGLTLKPLKEEAVIITPEIQKLIDERKKARDQKNWKRADEIRDILKKHNIDIKDDKTN